MNTDIKMIVKSSELRGEISAPPSKSYTHRAIICASLAGGISTILNPLLSDDINATICACEALGAKVLERGPEKIVIEGNKGKVRAAKTLIDCAESGSTLRFITPLAALAGCEIIITGKEGLKKRPVGDLLDALKQIGVKSESIESVCSFAYETAGKITDMRLPVKICGTGKIRGGKIMMRGDVSSQFISGLLFALPLAEGDSEIILTSRLESKDYVMITLDVLSRFGITIMCADNLEKFKIRGKQQYCAQQYCVEGDYSSAAFMLVAGALGGPITVSNLNAESKQGDRRIIDILKSMGARITQGKNNQENNYFTVGQNKNGLSSAEIDAGDIPDLVPIISIAAAHAEGTTTIKNVLRLRMKESDRLAGTSNILKKFGADARITSDVLEIKGKSRLNGCEIETLKDHRLVMAASIAGAFATGETIVQNPAAIKKSYPEFFDDFRKLGGDVMALSNTFGNMLKVQVLGESHGKRIGVIIYGVPKGITVSQEFIQDELDKRKSISILTTPRKEEDIVKIISGIEHGKTSGEPIRMEIENKDIKSHNYRDIKNIPRPGHADYTASVKYASVFDYRGGGFLSGRMTACFVAAGAVAKKILEPHSISTFAHVIRIGNVAVERTLSDDEIEKNRYSNFVRCADAAKANEMKAAIENAKKEGDSLGGVIECRVLDMPVGAGEPLFYSVESEISRAMFSIPAVKGVEFGSGFGTASMRGSEHNDPFIIKNGKIVTTTNNAGGILGGISNGMPIVFRVAIKPTSSIAKEQYTVEPASMHTAKISVEGRHDPCIAIRAVPVVEAMAALSIADLLICGDFIE